jgi:hypothetical protein
MEQSAPNFHTEPASKCKKARLLKEAGPFLVVNDSEPGPEGPGSFFFDALSSREPAIHPRIKSEGMPENATYQPRVRERIMKLS